MKYPVAKTSLPTLIDGDCRQQNAHSLFQIWRQSHPSGLFLNVNGKQTMLHSSSCPHFEGTELDREQWGGSLTKRRKVLGGTIAELRKWALEHGLVAKECRDCMKMPHSPADPEDGFRLLEQADRKAAEEEFTAGPSPRVPTTIQRIIRDTQLAANIKRLHEYRCQICGERIALPDGRFYAEAHHIRPLGSPYDGPDSEENILCVCPNHHVALDYGCFRIEKAKLRTRPDHRISDEHIDYHNSHIYSGDLDG
jgi:hypothetical protein